MEVPGISPIATLMAPGGYSDREIKTDNKAFFIVMIG
jgi:hypothetical protein